jgi:hypothetical protein
MIPPSKRTGNIPSFVFSSLQYTSLEARFSPTKFTHATKGTGKKKKIDTGIGYLEKRLE